MAPGEEEWRMLWPCSNLPLESCNDILRSPKSSRHDGEANPSAGWPSEATRGKLLQGAKAGYGTTAPRHTRGENIFSYLFPPNRG